MGKIERKVKKDWFMNPIKIVSFLQKKWPSDSNSVIIVVEIKIECRQIKTVWEERFLFSSSSWSFNNLFFPQFYSSGCFRLLYLGGKSLPKLLWHRWPRLGDIYSNSGLKCHRVSTFEMGSSSRTKSIIVLQLILHMCKKQFIAT